MKHIWRAIPVSNSNNPVFDILNFNNIPKSDWNSFLFDTVKDLPRINKAYNADKFIKRVGQAIADKEKICLYSDYDVDGITGASVAKLMIEELGGVCYVHTNNKKTDGYGINRLGLEKLFTRPEFPDTKLIITIDNGINAVDGINVAQENGLEVIVTDHHEPDSVNPASIVVDMKQGQDNYSFREFCGCGIIWKLLRELYIDKGLEDESLKYLDIVALGTVADVVPLIGENRIIVRHGLRLMNEAHRIAFKVFKESLGLKEINETNIGFQIAPCLNAKTRIDGDATDCIRMFTEASLVEIKTIIQNLVSLNNYRKEMTSHEEQIAINIVESTNIKDDKVIVIADTAFNGGIVGLTAGRLARKYARPVVVGEIMDNGIVRGSCRSYGDFDIHGLLSNHSEKLLSFGGHKMAAGFSLKAEDFNEFKYRLNQDDKTKEIKAEKIVNYLKVLDLNDINLSYVEQINNLSPYGEGFRRPLYRINNVPLDKNNTRLVGINDAHVKIDLKNIEILGWSLKDRIQHLNSGACDLIGDLTINSFRGQQTPQIVIYEDNIVKQV